MEGTVAMSRSRTKEIADAALFDEISFLRTAFHKAFASSTQNRSGTRNWTSSRRLDASSSSACATSSSRREGRHHFTATLASTTTLVTVRDPHGSFPRLRETVLG